MGEKVVGVRCTGKGADYETNMSIEEYYALSDERKRDCIITALITNTNGANSYYSMNPIGVSTSMNGKELRVSINKTGFAYHISDQEYKFSVKSDYNEEQQTVVSRIPGIRVTDEEVQALMGQEEHQKAVSEARKIIERFQPIVGLNFTLKHFKNYIETGRLFETPEEREEFERQTLQKRKEKEDRDIRLEEIIQELDSARKHVEDLEKAMKAIRDLDDEDNRAEYGL